MNIFEYEFQESDQNRKQDRPRAVRVYRNGAPVDDDVDEVERNQ